MASSANPVLSQIETAVSNGALSAFTPSEELTKKYISKRKSQAFGIFFGSLALLFVALLVTWLLISRLHVIVFSAKIVVIFLFILILPFYSVYNIFSTFSTISKQNYSFYLGEVVAKADTGYLVRGLENQKISFLTDPAGGAEKAPGAQVIVARFKDELDLIDLEPA